MKSTMFMIWILLCTYAIDHASCCHDGWIRSPRFPWCYKQFYRNRTWSEAKAECVNMNATLVSLIDKEEQQFVSGASLTRKVRSVWIGARLVSEWVDGKYRELEMYDWYSGYFRWGSSLSDNCASLRQGDLDFSDCYSKMPFICQTEDFTTKSSPVSKTANTITASTSTAISTAVIICSSETSLPAPTATYQLTSKESNDVLATTVVLATLLGVSIVLNLVLVASYARRRLFTTLPSQGHLYEATQPTVSGTEHVYQTCQADVALQLSNIYEEPTGTNNGTGNGGPRAVTDVNNAVGGKDSAYLDVRTPNNLFPNS